MASDQDSCSDEEPDSEMLSDDLCLPDSDDDRQPSRTVQVLQIIDFLLGHTTNVLLTSGKTGSNWNFLLCWIVHLPEKALGFIS